MSLGACLKEVSALPRLMHEQPDGLANMGPLVQTSRVLVAAGVMQCHGHLGLLPLTLGHGNRAARTSTGGKLCAWR